MLHLIRVTVVTAYARYLTAITLVILLQAESILFYFIREKLHPSSSFFMHIYDIRTYQKTSVSLQKATW